MCGELIQPRHSFPLCCTIEALSARQFINCEGNPCGAPRCSWLSRHRVGGDWSNLAGQYVGPNDMAAHKSVPGYVPRLDWQNALQEEAARRLVASDAEAGS